MNDPLIKTGAEILFYVALVVLVIVLLFKKKKQMRLINDELKDEIKRRESENQEE